MGLHRRINLSMQIPYHGRCLVDAGFANIKRLYQRTDVDSLSTMVEVVNNSAKSNVAVQYMDSEDGHNWEWYNWKVFLEAHFSTLRGIRKYQHFRFDVDHPGN